MRSKGRDKYDYDKLLKIPKNFIQREKNLRNAKSIFESLGLKFWLSDGAVLGFYRDGGFIEWDWDLDFIMFTEDMVTSYKAIAKAFRKSGFTVSVKLDSVRPKFGITLNGEKLMVTGYCLDKKRKLRVRVPYRFPDRLFRPGGTIAFNGETYPCPGPVEEYLELAYGDWRTPVKSGDPDHYRRGRGKFSAAVEARYQKKAPSYAHSSDKIVHGY